MRKTKDQILLFFKGFAMGSADVVPGVSGGTIAFITGIYEELLASISNLNFGLIKTLRKDGFKAAWKSANGSFLLVLLLGIATSFLTLAKVITFLLDTYPIHIWSFFFGLVLASVWLIGKTINSWNLKTITGLILGTIAAYLITELPPFTDSYNLWYIFVCGALAICAMILPGISGSFILVMLGAYTAVLGSISNLLSALKNGAWDLVFSNGLTLAVFASGCIIGLLLFSRILTFLFKKSKNLILAILTGFLIGSLNKIWPWKETLKSFIKHKGEPNESEIPLVQRNILPYEYEELFNESPFLLAAILCFIGGLALLILLEKFAPKSAE